MYKLKTIDVWDTLLRRDCHPECIKLATARHLLLGWSDKLIPNCQDLWTLYKARLTVESKLAASSSVSGLDDEYEITHVLHLWLEMVFKDKPDHSLSQDLAEFELQWEISRSFVDTGIIDHLHNIESERTIFLSDFYMSGEKLCRLLSEKGLSDLVAEGIASCDIGMNKRSGKLFHYVHGLYGISPEQHFHVGDNIWSDVEAPRKIGINAEHYLPLEAHAERVEREALFCSRPKLFEHILTEFSTNAGSSYQNFTEQQEAAFHIGADAAPLFVGFALWIAENALYNKIDRIFFLTREGDLFHKVYKEIFPENNFFGHKLPPASVLKVSRLSTFAASMKEVSIEEMERIWSLFKVQSVSGLFSTLAIDINPFIGMLDKYGLKVTDTIQNPSKNASLKKLFEEPLFVNAAHESIRLQNELLNDYLQQSGLVKGENVALVDIGWRGTIQDNLAIVRPDIKFHGFYLGLRKFINSQPSNTSKSAYALNENLTIKNLNFFENFSLLEMLCVSNDGSVVGYQKVGNEVFAVHACDEHESLTFNRFTKQFQEGVIAASRNWGSYVHKYVVGSEELLETSLKVWNTLRKSPSQNLVDAFIQSPQHDLFGYGEFFHRNQFPSLGTIFQALIITSKRRSLIEFVRRLQWVAPIEQAQEINFFHRYMLVLVFRLANIFKIVRAKTTKG